jgi:hypothetical protein
MKYSTHSFDIYTDYRSFPVNFREGMSLHMARYCACVYSSSSAIITLHPRSLSPDIIIFDLFEFMAFL